MFRLFTHCSCLRGTRVKISKRSQPKSLSLLLKLGLPVTRFPSLHAEYLLSGKNLTSLFPRLWPVKKVVLFFFVLKCLPSSVSASLFNFLSIWTLFCSCFGHISFSGINFNAICRGLLSRFNCDILVHNFCA